MYRICTRRVSTYVHKLYVQVGSVHHVHEGYVQLGLVHHLHEGYAQLGSVHHLHEGYVQVGLVQVQDMYNGTLYRYVGPVYKICT